MKKILILNGSFCELPLIQEAKAQGYYVITTGNMPELMGHQYADDYIEADYSDKELILQIVQNHQIDAILSCANDFGVLTAAYVAEQMGWKGHDTYENAKLMHHKDLFKEYARKHNMPSPSSEVFTDINEAKKYIEAANYPIIVKANDLTGGKGIMRADNIEMAKVALENAFSMSRDKHIVIEAFIEGTQHTIDGFLVNKKIVSYASCNCYSPVNPYLIQSETLPADGIDEVKDELISHMEAMAEDLNLADGIIAFQYMVQNGKPYIFEMMRRPFGNQFLALLENVTGFPWHKAQIMAETGQDCTGLKSVAPKMTYCGHHGIMAPRNGIVKSYTIPEEIENHIYKKIEMNGQGCEITNHMNERVAYIYYEYDNQQEMNKAVKTFHDKIKVEME